MKPQTAFAIGYIGVILSDKQKRAELINPIKFIILFTIIFTIDIHFFDGFLYYYLVQALNLIIMFINTAFIYPLNAFSRGVHHLFSSS